MDKHDLLVNLSVERAQLFHALLGASAEEIESARAVGEWSPRDVLAHLVGWERYVYDVVRHLRARRPVTPNPDVADQEAYNAKVVAVWRTKSLKELIEALAISHRQLTVAIAGSSQPQLDLEQPVGSSRDSISNLTLSVARRDAEYTRHLKAWRPATHPDEVGPKIVLQHALEACRSSLLTLIDLIPLAQRETLPVTGAWTIRDVCGHIADWDNLVVEGTLAMEKNERISWERQDYGEVWNQFHAAARCDQSWNRVWRDFVDVRGTVVTELAERVLEPDLARMIPSPWGGQMSFFVWLAISCRHDMEHVESLLAWRASQSAPK